MILLIGIPGSGKSTFAATNIPPLILNRLVTSFPAGGRCGGR